jgi:hypothetical protein
MQLIPALFLSTLINKKRVRPVEYLLAIFICFGLVCFSVADATVYPDMNPLGRTRLDVDLARISHDLLFVSQASDWLWFLWSRMHFSRHSRSTYLPMVLRA